MEQEKIDVWLLLAKEKYPYMPIEKLKSLSMLAATSWYSGEKNEYTELFDQYVMLKNLKGLT